MAEMSLYEEAHVLVAAIRILEYRKSASPSFKDIGELLNMNTDRVARISNDLRTLGIIEMVDGPFETVNLIVSDHVEIEKISREVKKSNMDEEIKKFKEQSENAYEKKVKAFTEESKKKEQALFEELEKKFKSETNK